MLLECFFFSPRWPDDPPSPSPTPTPPLPFLRPTPPAIGWGGSSWDPTLYNRALHLLWGWSHYAHTLRRSLQVWHLEEAQYMFGAELTVLTALPQLDKNSSVGLRYAFIDILWGSSWARWNSMDLKYSLTKALECLCTLPCDVLVVLWSRCPLERFPCSVKQRSPFIQMSWVLKDKVMFYIFVCCRQISPKDNIDQAVGAFLNDLSFQ